jgi:hypothetical protein
MRTAGHDYDMTQWGLDQLFNPSKRHMDEEKQRLQATREEVGDASGGERIDFTSGKVTIRKKGQAAEPTPSATAAVTPEADPARTRAEADAPDDGQS